MDVAIINGKVYMDGRFVVTNVYVKDGLIAAITERELEAEKCIDATGLWVLPGLIDPHVHLRLKVGDSYSRDDFAQGSKKAAYGGVTTLIDFLDPVNTLSEAKDAYERRCREAQEIYVDYGFHMTVKDYKDNIDDLMKWILEAGMPSVKLFTTYSSTERRTPMSTIERLLKKSGEYGVRILVHAEKEDLIDESSGAAICKHGLRRPPESEWSIVLPLAEATKQNKGFLYVVHTNCGTTLSLLEQKYPALISGNKQEAPSLCIETCPHYLAFNADYYQREDGYNYVMTPPLRPEEERQELVRHLPSVDTIGTDHCPYPHTQKKSQTLDDCPNGIEGMPYTLPFLYTRYGEDLLPAVTFESAKIHGLYPKKGTIQIGSDGDLVLFDPNNTWRVEGELPWLEANEPIEASPYYGMLFTGSVVGTLLRGQHVVDGQSFYKMKGQYQRRKGVFYDNY